MSYKLERIGKVKLFIPVNMHEDDYTDKAEDELLNIYKSKDSESKINEILNNNPPWHLYYHLTPSRGNLVKWYNFKANSNVLEIGAGCGAITEELTKHNINLTALELTHKRSIINAYRNINSSNLSIYIDNLQNFKVKEKFDYIVCVGVLEYAGMFIHSDNPYEDFLKILKNYLKPGGTLLLAIENRFGLKYWSGASEDHTHNLFDGQNGYSSTTWVQTFGRKELKIMMKKVGFKKDYFYYPFPDYKIPMVIFSDDIYPGDGIDFPLGLLPSPSLDSKRYHFFSEQSVMNYLEKNDLFRDFSNSFLIEVTA